MKEEYIVMDKEDYYGNAAWDNIAKARKLAERFASQDACEQIVLKVVGKVSPPGKVVWDPDFEGE